MKKAVSCFAILSCIAVSTPAAAYPSIRGEQAGSSLSVYTANSEDRAYNCTVTYSWSYMSFGEEKTGSESFSTNVGAKQGEQRAHRFAGSYPQLRFTDGPQFAGCNPA